MISWLVGVGLKVARLVVAVAIGLLGVGVYQLSHAPVDVYPEFDPPAVQIRAEALGLSAQEVEQLITVPLEQDLLNGIPWLEHISSKSMAGLSAIDLHFEPGTDLQAARQMTQERMTQAKALPNVGTPPIMVQPTSSTSRVAMISMHSESVSLMQMSVLARWQIRPRLMSIPGVANVSVWGLRDRQLQVQVDPARLQSRKVTLTQLI
jgi:Cu/Ag efflux pump CusA